MQHAGEVCVKTDGVEFIQFLLSRLIEVGAQIFGGDDRIF